MSKNGLFIVFEGIEKCGKKTQSELLKDALDQITEKDTLLIEFPDKNTPIGKIIAKYISGEIELDPHAAHLLFTANRWEHQDRISKALKSGINVIADRYSYSGIVNTAARLNSISELDWKWCRSIERGLIEPDFIFLLSPDSVAAITCRTGYGTNRFETVDFQDRVLHYYARLSTEMEKELKEERDIPDSTDPQLWYWIEATGQPMADIHSCIMTILDSKI